MTALERQDDLKWLSDVHGIPTEGAAIAIIHGNEDSPNKVEVYAENDVNCVPDVYVLSGESYKLVWERLEELRAILRAESISYGELSELEDLVDYIDEGDVELLEAAGATEFSEKTAPSRD